MTNRVETSPKIRAISVDATTRAHQQAARKPKRSTGTRPPALDTEAYKDRHVVENHFGWIKQWRGITTRYDKLTITYRAGVLLAAALAWI